MEFYQLEQSSSGASVFQVVYLVAANGDRDRHSCVGNVLSSVLWDFIVCDGAKCIGAINVLGGGVVVFCANALA